MECQKCNCDQKCRAAQLGDLVLLKKDAVIGRPKLQDCWHDELCEVMAGKADDTPVCVITSTKSGNEIVVHRNKLLVVQLTEDTVEETDPGKPDSPQSQPSGEEGKPEEAQHALRPSKGKVGTRLGVRDSPASVTLTDRAT